jgi:hypothetical protein
MGNSVYDQITRDHPAYRAGFNAGRDVGLIIALTIITGKEAGQDASAIVASLDIRQPGAARHEYASGRLHAVATIIAVRFRQQQDRLMNLQPIHRALK